MKRSALLITLLIILIAGGYLLFDKYYKSEPTSLWNLVPANAIAVYETNNGATNWDRIRTTPAWQALTGIESIERFSKNLDAIDTLNSTNDGLDQLLSGPFLISMHLVGQNTFDYLFLVDLTDYKSQFMINTMVENFENDSLVTETVRVYQDMEITELVKGEQIFSYLIYDNKLVATFTPFLVEDVIRGIADPESPGFFDVNPSILSMPKLSEDDGNLYLSVKNFGNFTMALAGPNEDANARTVNRVASAMFLDVSVKDQTILMNGFTDAGQGNTLLNTFQGQSPVELNYKFMLPLSTAIFQEYAFTDALAWQQRMSRYWKEHTPQYARERQDFAETVDIDLQSVYGTLGQSLALIEMETAGSTDFQPVGLVKTRDNAGLRNLLNTLGESIARANGDSTYVEQYGIYEIRELNIPDFPRLVIGPQFEGFTRTYFTFYDHETLLLAPDLITLKEYIDAVDSENTWGRSVLFNRFLDGVLKEANVTVMVNSRRAWEYFLSKSDAEWTKFARENAQILKSFGLFSIQFSKLSDSFYTSIQVQHDGQRIQVARAQDTPPKMKATLNAKAATKPFVVVNHVDNSRETFIQDTSQMIYLIDKNGETSWSQDIGKTISSPVKQVDFYANGKLQYFFATDSALHIIDRLGNYVDGYPLKLPFRIKYATVIDYDNSKRYRFLVTDDFGNLTLLNKEGEALEGWSPKSLGGRLSSAPFHARIRGRDCIVAMEASGKVHVMNRRGEYYPGFPMNLEARVESPVFFQPGATFRESNFTVVDKDGKLTSFTLEGKITSAAQLYMPTTETSFSLVPDVLGKTFILARKDRRRLVLLDRDQQEIMSKDYLDNQPQTIQFYDFGSDIQVYSVCDQVQGFTYIYDANGTMIGSRPLGSEMPVSLLYSELNKQFTIYYASENEVLVRTF